MEQTECRINCSAQLFELKLRVLGICAGQKSFVKLKTRHFDGASSSSVVLKKLSAQCFLINYCFSAFLQALFKHILKEFYVEGKISIYFMRNKLP